MGTRYEVNGTSIHIQEFGNVEAPPLLYLHGGPGTGTYDFVYHQAERLSMRLRVIVMDQRGVPQSAALADDESCTLQDIIADCESIRQLLGIECWSVLGHSFGGYLALLYAQTYPAAIHKLLFENATFDLAMTTRWMLHAVAMEYAADGHTEKAKSCLELVYSSTSLRHLDEQGWKLINGLGSRRNHLYVHEQARDFFSNPPAGHGLPQDHWQKASVHQKKIYQDPLFSESLLPYRCAKEIPTLLIKGKYDGVMGNDQIFSYMSSNTNTELVVFEESAHFPHFEEPDRFAEAVIRFVER